MKVFSTFFISLSVAISSILSTLADWTADDCLFVFTNSFIAALKINVAGSLEFTGRLLLKLSADLDFQNFFSKSSIDLFIFLKSLNLSNIKAHENIELAINKIIANFTTKSALKKRFHREKSDAPPNPTTWSCNILFHQNWLITFRMCHEFGVIKENGSNLFF